MMARILLITMACLTLQGCAAVLIGGVATGAAIAHDRRSAGAIFDDQKIEIKARQLLQDDPKRGKSDDVSVTSYNYSVLLTGRAKSRRDRNHYADLVKTIPGVRRVVNEIAVGAGQPFSEHSNDASLTADAKLALFKVHLPGFDPSRVKVVSSQGTVYLMGLVTVDEGKAATQQVRYIRDVKRVVKVFEYISG